MRAGKQILIVEDDASTRNALRVLLGAAGYEVTSAANGREALDYLQQAEPPFAVLLDLNMPVLDGWQFLRERRRDPDLAGIAVLVVSGETDLPRIATSLGAAGYLAKPIEFHDLLTALHSLGHQQKAGS